MYVASVQARRYADSVSSLLKKAKSVDGSLLTALDSAEEIVLTYSVEAELEGRLDAECLDRVEKLLINEPTVSVNAVNSDLALQKLLYDIEEVGTNERLTARDANLRYSALDELIHSFDKLLVSRISVLSVGSGHKAMSAFEVTLTRDRPMHLSLVSAGEKLIFLLGKKHISECRLANYLVFNESIEKFLYIFRELISVYAVKAVALSNNIEFLLTQKYRRLSQCIIYGEGNLLPTAQAVSFIEDIEHISFLSL
jgi:hypothetical protein